MSTTRRRNAILRGAIAIPLVLVLGAPATARADQPEDETTYDIEELDSLGGTRSAGSSINNRGWIAGSSNRPNDQVVHAALWHDGDPTDLGTLGGPNSAVLWPVKNNRGIVVGVAETAELDRFGELWSCFFFFFFFFFPGDSTGHVCRGFVWDGATMEALPTHGGTHGFATGANNSGHVVGWAETPDEDPTCNDPQIFGFLAALWNPHRDTVQKLPPLAGDTASAATAINDRGQVVGISGDCANAVGGFSARHSVLWEHGKATKIDDFGGVAWNTPMAINEAGVAVGFANQAGIVGDRFFEEAFVLTEEDGITGLGFLGDDVRSQALGVNIHGQVVGFSRGPAGDRAFIWQDGEMKNLTALAPGYDGRLVFANDINDAGVITGQAINAETGDLVAFVATPTRG